MTFCRASSPNMEFGVLCDVNVSAAILDISIIACTVACTVTCTVAYARSLTVSQKVTLYSTL